MVNHMAMKFSDLIMYPLSYSYKKCKIPINYASSALSISYKRKIIMSRCWSTSLSGNLKNKGVLLNPTTTQRGSFAHIICPLKSFWCMESSYDVAFLSAYQCISKVLRTRSMVRSLRVQKFHQNVLRTNISKTRELPGNAPVNIL